MGSSSSSSRAASTEAFLLSGSFEATSDFASVSLAVAHGSLPSASAWALGAASSASTLTFASPSASCGDLDADSFAASSASALTGHASSPLRAASFRLACGELAACCRGASTSTCAAATPSASSVVVGNFIKSSMYSSLARSALLAKPYLITLSRRCSAESEPVLCR